MGRAGSGPEVVVELGDKKRTLRFDAVVLEDIEEELGINLLVLAEQVVAGALGEEEVSAQVKAKLLRARNISGVVWALLLHEEESLTRRQVGRWLSGAALASVPVAAVNLIVREMKLAVEGVEASEEADPTEATATP